MDKNKILFLKLDISKVGHKAYEIYTLSGKVPECSQRAQRC